MESVRELDLENFDGSFDLEMRVSLGILLEEAFADGIIGTEGDIVDQVGFQAVRHDGVTFNASDCYILCGGFLGTYDENPIRVPHFEVNQ